MNGKRVTEEYFAPGASQYDRHLMYQTYDVTELVQEGENGLGCILASDGGVIHSVSVCTIITTGATGHPSLGDW